MKAEVAAKDLIRFFTQTLIPDIKESDPKSGYILDFQTIVKVLRAQLAGKSTASINKIIQKAGFEGHDVQSFANWFWDTHINKNTKVPLWVKGIIVFGNSADVILTLRS